MGKFREVYITIGDFAFLQSTDRPYEGFIIGLGYAFVYSSAIQPPDFNGYSHADDVPPQMNRFRLVRNQYVDNSPEMIERSLNGITANGARIYTVRQGDTLTAIAREYRVSVEDLIKWNKLSDPDRLQIGQKLTVSEKIRDLLYNYQQSQLNSNNPETGYNFFISDQDKCDLEHYLGPALIISGLKIVPKYGGIGGGGAAGKWTSVASKVSRAADRAIQERLGTNIKFPARGLIHKLFGTRGIGAVVGRAAPYVGWGLTAWDIGWELGEKYGPIQYYLKQRKSKEEEKKIKELLEYLNKDANK